MEDMLWPDDFEDLEVETCDAPLCDLPVAYGANLNYPGETKLCEGHHTKWCRDYQQRPRHHIEQPKYLSFQEYFKTAVPLP